MDPVLTKDVLKWAAQIPLLSQLEIPRHVWYGEDAQYSLHVLCDSSLAATAAAVFLRIEINGIVMVYLLFSKSRVAPRTKASIPRLELVACVIAARLLITILAYLGDPILPITLWSDSSTALAWIRGTGHWGLFVTNRVREVRTLTDVTSWRHISGKENIADLPSRGCSAQRLLDSKWWRGPDWPYLPPEQWPTSEQNPDINLVNGERKKIVTSVTSNASNPLLNFLRISDYPRILKSLSLWLMLKEKLKRKVNNPEELLNENTGDEESSTHQTTKALQKAELYLLTFIQEDLKRDPQSLKKLNPFLDEDKLIRTKT